MARKLASAADLVVCADGGANGARNMHVKPDIILGDMDSILPATRRAFRRVPLMYIEEQSSTDMEKVLRYCIERGVAAVDVIGATGDRIDHTTGNLGCFRKFSDRVTIRFIDSLGVLTLIRGETSFRMRIGEKLSLIPLDRCSGVTTRNLKYSLRNDTLELGVREGISNEATGRSVRILVRKGALLLYRFHQGTL